MFGSKNKAQNLKLEQLLHQMGSKLPETNWILLLDKKGRTKAAFSDFIDDVDRAVAMSAAVHALGNRITKELKGGELRYAFLKGTLNDILIVPLGTKYAIAFGLRLTIPFDDYLQSIQISIQPLLQELDVDLGL